MLICCQRSASPLDEEEGISEEMAAIGIEGVATSKIWSAIVANFSIEMVSCEEARTSRTLVGKRWKNN